MKFNHEKLDDGRTKVACLDENGCVLEIRILSKQTVDLLSGASGGVGYEFGKSMWIPIINTKTK